MQAGKTMGIFYIESPATRQLLAKAGRVDFEHVVIYSSIIRPAANRFTNLMLERIHGKAWKLPHPDLEFLRESYGIMVYEEQVSMATRVLAESGQTAGWGGWPPLSTSAAVPDSPGRTGGLALRPGSPPLRSGSDRQR